MKIYVDVIIHTYNIKNPFALVTAAAAAAAAAAAFDIFRLDDLDNGRWKVQGLAYVYFYTYVLPGWLAGLAGICLISRSRENCDRNKINIATPIYSYKMYIYTKIPHALLLLLLMLLLHIAYFPCQDMCSKSTYKKEWWIHVRFIVTTCAVYLPIWPRHFYVVFAAFVRLWYGNCHVSVPLSLSLFLCLYMQQ